MNSLRIAIGECPIIDNHAHNLLLSSELSVQSLLSATSEANGPALEHAKSTLAHYKAVNQLAQHLNCSPTWKDVTARINEARKYPEDAWAKKCFRGIATVLIDDGLDKDTVHPVAWHNRLTPYPCKRIVRIEVIAQDIIQSVLGERPPDPARVIFARFTAAIEAALEDPDVVGFKSVICYRTGLAVPVTEEIDLDALDAYIAKSKPDQFKRLQDKTLNPIFVNLAAQIISRHVGPGKAFQFHTGLGDNDIQLTVSSAAFLQPLIATYPKVKFVILHASYPYTREAGYLASVYSNCFLDIGEVFPMISQNGQEHVIRQALELCPTEKLCWSTDGHWFPETYLLAVLQVREGLEKVLSEYVSCGSLSVQQAIKTAQDILYNTSNSLYALELPALSMKVASSVLIAPRDAGEEDDYSTLRRFLARNPSVKHLHLQYIDYTATRRGRVIPINRALSMLQDRSYVGIQRGIFRQLQNDTMVPGTVHQGEWALKPCLEGLRPTYQSSIASTPCEIQFKDGSPLKYDPRTVLRRVLENAHGGHDMRFLIGFEIEVVFMSPTPTADGFTFQAADLNYGHAWSTSTALESTGAAALIQDVLAYLERVGIEVEQYHAEGSKSQFEFILAPLPAMQAVDGLIAARAAIAAAADSRGLRATLIPKASPEGFGTGAHMHLSFTPEDEYPSFYAGVLQHMRGLMAFAMSSEASYARMGDGVWSGGTWVCWGDQNREACLRRIKDSHWECKVVDGLANPYLFVAGLIGAGMDGVAENLPLPSGSVDTTPGDLNELQRQELGITERLPDSLEESLDALERDSVLAQILGQETVETYLAVKRTEAELLGSMAPTKRHNWLIERY